MPPLPLSARSFLYSFLVIGLALAASFVAVSEAIKGKVREELRQTLLRQEALFDHVTAEHSRQVSGLIAVLGESAGLKAGLGLLRELPQQDAAKQIRRTLEAQLRDLSSQVAYDLLAVADPDNRPLAAVVARNGSVALLDPDSLQPPVSGLLRLQGKLYETIRVPIHLQSESLGSLTLGREFNLQAFTRAGDTALLYHGRIMATTLSPARAWEAQQRLASDCITGFDQCEIALAGETHLVLPMREATLRDGYSLVSLQSLDAATRQFTQAFGNVFLWIGAGTLLIALVSSAWVSRSIAGPLRELVERLTLSERTGKLPNDFPTSSPTREVNRLSTAFNRAANAISDSQRSLDEANLEFIETMARALDARDRYTAGHSESVSRYAVAIARALDCPPQEVERIRVGAKLHDIGKIGIPDAVLQKPGKLTELEYKLIQQHPQIGRRILERLSKFREYLPIVELHHEDYDGGGYPYGRPGDEIPLEARIVHVADVYDALTSDRAYRKRMPEHLAQEILRNSRGRQFDPQVVDAFLGVLSQFEWRPALAEDSVEVELVKSA